MVDDAALVKACKTLANTKTPWATRRSALGELDELLASMKGHDVRPHLNALVDALKPNLLSLRSELVRAAAATLATACRELGHVAVKLARRLMPTLIEVASSTNSVIRKHGLNAAPAVLQSVHSNSVLDEIIRALAAAKSKLQREACTEFLRQVLAFWPLGDKYTAYAETLEESVRVALRAAETSVRKTGSQLFWLYCGHFPQRRDAFTKSLDAREQRIVERAGKTVEEESKEYFAATKIAALARGRIARRKTRDSITLARALMLGERVAVKSAGGAPGTVRFHGEVPTKSGTWIGVVLDRPRAGAGDGTAGGERLMDCDARCGLFVRVLDVERMEGDGGASAAAAAGAAETPSKKPSGRGAGSTPASHVTPASRGAGAGDADGDSDTEEDEMKMLPGADGKLTASPLVLLEALRDGPPADMVDGSGGNGAPRPVGDRGSASGSKLRAPSARHQRVLSVPDANERELLALEHKLHMKACAELLDEEMNLIEKTRGESYVDDVVALMDRFIEHSQLVRSKFADFRRRTGNQEVLEDDFLAQMDNFGS